MVVFKHFRGLCQSSSTKLQSTFRLLDRCDQYKPRKSPATPRTRASDHATWPVAADAAAPPADDNFHLGAHLPAGVRRPGSLGDQVERASVSDVLREWQAFHTARPH